MSYGCMSAIKKLVGRQVPGKTVLARVRHSLDDLVMLVFGLQPTHPTGVSQ